MACGDKLLYHAGNKIRQMKNSLKIFTELRQNLSTGQEQTITGQKGRNN